MHVLQHNLAKFHVDIPHWQLCSCAGGTPYAGSPDSGAARAQEVNDVDAKFQAILPHADPAAEGEGAAAALGALALSKQRRPQRQNAFAHFRKAPLLPKKSLLSGSCA